MPSNHGDCTGWKIFEALRISWACLESTEEAWWILGFGRIIWMLQQCLRLSNPCEISPLPLFLPWHFWNVLFSSVKKISWGHGKCERSQIHQCPRNMDIEPKCQKLHRCYIDTKDLVLTCRLLFYFFKWWVLLAYFQGTLLLAGLPASLWMALRAASR